MTCKDKQRDVENRRAQRAVRIINRQRRLRLDASAIRKLARAVLARETVAARAGVNLMFVRDPVIREYNRKYLHKDRPTDVMSFLTDQPPGLSENAGASVGDIVISVDQAVAYANTHALDLSEELARYIIHGILHCVGYDDARQQARRHMFRRQEEILEEWLAQGGTVLRI